MKKVIAFLCVLSVAGLALAERQPDESCVDYYIDSVKGFGTRLMFAVMAGDIPCVNEFLVAGDRINANDRFGYKSVGYAAYRGHVDVLKVLWENGARIDESQGGDGTPLVIASCNGRTEVVKFLLETGVSLGATDEAGATAADNACKCKGVNSGCPGDYIIGLLGEKMPSVLFGQDFPSADGAINDGKIDTTSSNKECWELCLRTTACKAWTRIKRSIEGGSSSGECWLRNFIPLVEECDNCDSGIVSCEITENLHYTTSEGILNDGHKDITASNRECCAMCTARQDCLSWTRIKSDKEYNKEGECWLRDHVSKGEYCKQCDSGVKTIM